MIDRHEDGFHGRFERRFLGGDFVQSICHARLIVFEFQRELTRLRFVFEGGEEFDDEVHSAASCRRV